MHDKIRNFVIRNKVLNFIPLENEKRKLQAKNENDANFHHQIELRVESRV